MAVSIAYSSGTSYIAIDGSESQAVTLPTGGGIIVLIKWSYGATNVANIGSISLSVDGTPDDITSLHYPANGSGLIAAYWSNITTASQNLLYTNSGAYVEGNATIYTVSGHNSAAPFGTETLDTEATTLNFTFDTTGDAVLVPMWGTEATGLTFGEGTWSHNGGAGDGIVYWCSDLTAGAKSLTVSNGVPSAAVIIEIVAGSSQSQAPRSTVRSRFMRSI